MPSLMGGTSGGFRQPTNGTASAVAGSSAAWACLLLLGLIFAGVVGLILVGARISASPPRSLAAGPAAPAFTILAVGGDARRVDARRVDARRVDARRVDARRVDAAFRRVVLLPASGAASAQLPPRDVAVSSFRRAARAPAHSSFRLNLKAQPLRMFHRAGPLAAASTTRRCFRRAAPSDARRTMRAGQHRPLQYHLNYSTYLQVGLSPSPTQPGLGQRPGRATQAVTSTVTATTAQ